MGCWSEDLPLDVLSLISTFLTKNSDYIRFRSVCVWWRRAAAAEPRHLPLQQLLLIRPNIRPNTVNSANRGFCSLSTKKTHWIQLPETLQKRCCGSSHGWLAFVDRSPDVFLFNPLTRARIDLPAITTLDCVDQASKRRDEYRVRYRTGREEVRCSTWMRDYCIGKIVLSSSPHAGVPWTAMALLGLTGDIMLWRPGDANWTVIVRRAPTLDIACCNGLFYSFDRAGKLAAVDADPSADAKATDVMGGLSASIWYKNYLVESGGELLLAVRHEYDLDARPGCKTCCFDVCKLLDLKGKPKRSMVKSLGDRALFLGKNHSFSLSSADIPGCRGNCIYFTDDLLGYVHGHIRGHDSRRCSIEDDSIRPSPCPPIASCELWSPPVWITPNLR
ncbi:F-box protein SKIP23-like [Phoenix dactylifera]|uniref:F-box protein SKIP23-like n=1 Tax=Phoenix dactylifera TaxID=42345 RepID=A0A8B8ZEG7_PHODC|nr:F-box protein SKIP23-like [Phoenix dactylifera]